MFLCKCSNDLQAYFPVDVLQIIQDYAHYHENVEVLQTMLDSYNKRCHRLSGCSYDYGRIDDVNNLWEDDGEELYVDVIISKHETGYAAVEIRIQVSSMKSIVIEQLFESVKIMPELIHGLNNICKHKEYPFDTQNEVNCLALSAVGGMSRFLSNIHSHKIHGQRSGDMDLIGL